MRVSIVQDTETEGDVTGQKGSATDTSLSRVTHAAVPASGGRRLNTPQRRCGKYRRLHSVCCRALLSCNWMAVISSIGGKASKSSFGVKKGCGLYCGAGAESGFR